MVYLNTVLAWKCAIWC